MNSLARLQAVLRELRETGQGTTGGAEPEVVAAAERDLGTRIPDSLRLLLDTTDGLALCGGLVRVWSAAMLPIENKGLHSPDGWFKARHLFFAESATPEEFQAASTEQCWGPDFFYVDCMEGCDPPVRLFHLSPTKRGVAAPTLADWLLLVVGSGGFGARPDFDWS